MTKSSTAQLAEFVSETRGLPQGVQEVAKLHIADTLACIFAGSSSQAVEMFTRVCAPQADDGRFVVPGLGRWEDPSLASMLIGLCAHADDFDDTSEYSMNGHPSASVVSALIAMACITPTRGSDFIRAYAVGIEVACKLGIAFGEAHTRHGWHTMSTLGALGATAAAANLRGLNAEQTERAVAIACSFAGGILGNTGTMTKALHCGRAAQAAYLAVSLAREGFTASADILERKAGFLDVLTDSSLSSIVLPAMGSTWELTHPGLAAKLYPCCSCTHLAIDAAREIRDMQGFNVAKVEAITCFVREECTHYLRFPAPSSGIEAKFSMNYAVAVALAYGNVTLRDFDDDSIGRDNVLRMMPRVTMVVASSEDREGAVELTLSDGTRFNVRRLAPRGSPDDPATWTDIAHKLEGALGRSKRPYRGSVSQLAVDLKQLERIERFVDLLNS